MVRLEKAFGGEHMERENFAEKIYTLVKEIPKGCVASYGQLAAMVGSPRAARIVGAAMRRAPTSLPCHRVIYSDGRLCREWVFGGSQLQRQMLEREGVSFLPDGRVNMKLHQWRKDILE